jgi:hypothetical protein
MSNLLIIGDSFSENTTEHSWTQLLGIPATNLSSRGISEYKIYKKLESIDPTDFSHVIINHTSPNRIYIPHNPLYQDNQLYQNCDLIYTDIKSREPDPFAKNVSWWFENVFDLEHAEFMHQLLIKHIQQLVPDAIHITFFDVDYPGITSLYNIWQANPGTINHMTTAGNLAAAEYIRKLL